MTLRRLIPLAAFVALLGAQASAPSDLDGLVVGKSAAGLTFLPIRGDGVVPLAEPGKPTVLIAFASWCSGCIDEMPRNLQNYAKYKDRVAFLGVDYYDDVKAGDALIAKYAIPFPVERVNIQKSAPADAGASPPPGIDLQLHGVTPATLSSVLPAIAKQMPPDIAARLSDIAQHCTGIPQSDCLAYAQAHGVELDASGHVVAPPQTRAPASSKSVATLPATYVIDANGVVVQRFEGYDPDSDPIPAALAALGIR